MNFRDELELTLPKLYPRALQLCRSADRAQDLLQETAVRALRFERQFTIGTNLKAWLGQILSSVFFSALRRRSTERAAAVKVENDPSLWCQAEQGPVFRSLTAGLERELSQLPKVFRDVVLLVDLHSYTYADAASRLGIPAGTVMSRLSRGRRLLRQNIEPRLAA